MNQCTFCQKTFPSASKLQRHHLIHTGQKPFTCLFCGKAFRQSVHLKKHIETHTGKKYLNSFNNSTQNDSYTSYLLQSGLENYGESTQEPYKQDFSNITHASPVFTTDDAQAEDTWGRLTQAHGHSSSEIKYQREHEPQVSPNNGIATDGRFLSNSLFERTDSSAILDDSGCYADSEHTCTTCGKSFSSSLQLQIHLPVHESLTPFECGTCGRSFTSQTEILLHLESHDNVVLTENFPPISTNGQRSHKEFTRPTVNHQCPSCTKTFCSPSKLKRHFLTHTGQRPFSCVICEKTFRQATHLKTHLYAHRNLRPQNVLKANHVNDGHQHDPVNTAVEMEVQCEISVSARQQPNNNEIEPQEIVKIEGGVEDSHIQPNSCSETIDYIVENRQQSVTQRDCKPFQCPLCKKSFRLSVHLKRHQVTHKNQNKSPIREPSHESHLSHFRPDKRMASPDQRDDKVIGLDVCVKSEKRSQHPSDKKMLPLPEDGGLALFDNPPVVVQSTSDNRIINHKSHQCLTCSKGFPSPSKLYRHTLSHTGQRPFSCQMCDKSFRQQTHLRVHARTHLWSKYHKQRQTHINRPPSRSMYVNKPNALSPANFPLGDKLPKKFKFKMNSDLTPMTQAATQQVFLSKLKDSQRKALFLPPQAHWSEQSTRPVSKAAAWDKSKAFNPVQSSPPKKHQCCFCLKDFPSASKLQRHNLVHTDMRPHLCLTCGKTFRQAPHLKAHERTHSMWRPIQQITQQELQSVTKEKTQQQHQYPKINICVPLKTTNVKTDTSHLSTDHGADIISGTWGSYGKNRINIPIKRKQVHHSKMISKTTDWNKRAHLCMICQKSFTTPYKLSRHFLIHSGVKPYKCNVCPKRFTQANHLKKHEHLHSILHHVEGLECKENDLQAIFPIEQGTPEIYSAELADSIGEGQLKKVQLCQVSAASNPVTGEAFSHDSETNQSQCSAVADIPAKFIKYNKKDNCGSKKPHILSSFPSALAAEIQKQSILPDIVPTSSLEERNASVDIVDRQTSFKTSGPAADADNYNKQVDVVENSLLTELWCEPLGQVKCCKCDTTFNSNMDVELHNCVTGSQPKVTKSSQYQCAVCFKEFVSPSKLKRHYVTHTGQRPFKCEICDKSFTQSTHLKTHLRSHQK